MTRQASRARVLAIFVLLAVVACGPAARERTLHATLSGLSAASSGLVAWDRDHQAAIAAAATSEADGVARLTAYRAARARVVDLFAAAYHALAIAAIADKEPASLASALTAAELAAKAWAELKGAP